VSSVEVGVPNGQILYENCLAHEMQPLTLILKIKRRGIVARLPRTRLPCTTAAACSQNQDRKNREQKYWFHRSFVQRSNLY